MSRSRGMTGKQHSAETRAKMRIAALGRVLTPETKDKIRAAMIGRKSHGRRPPIHGMSRTRTYKSWEMMKQRCLNPNAPDYSRYGGRGVAIAAVWLTFSGFYATVGDRPDGMTLDRPDNDGNYGPDNWRWATVSEQNSNKRKNT